jgi:hypothetical protein
LRRGKPAKPIESLNEPQGWTLRFLEEVDVLSLGICRIRQVVLEKKRRLLKGEGVWVIFRSKSAYGNPASVLLSTTK